MTNANIANRASIQHVSSASNDITTQHHIGSGLAQISGTGQGPRFNSIMTSKKDSEITEGNVTDFARIRESNLARSQADQTSGVIVSQTEKADSTQQLRSNDVVRFSERSGMQMQREDTIATDKSPADFIKKKSTIGVDTISQQNLLESDDHSGTELGLIARGSITYQS